MCAPNMKEVSSPVTKMGKVTKSKKWVLLGS